VPLHDVSHYDKPEAAQAWMEANMAMPFALFGKPLFRVSLLKLRDDYFYYFMNCHHLIVDAWVLSLIVKSVGETYTALSKGEVVQLSAPAYSDLVIHDTGYRDSPSFKRDQQYWMEKYRLLPEPLLLPRYRDHFPLHGAPSRSHEWRLARDTFNRLVELASSLRSTVFHVMLGAFYAYFARLIQHNEIVIDLPILNRSKATYKATVGLFASISPIRLCMGTEARFQDLVQHIGQTLKQDYRHQYFSISELHRDLELYRIGVGNCSN
jgi:hypothetical protein